MQNSPAHRTSSRRLERLLRRAAAGIAVGVVPLVATGCLSLGTAVTPEPFQCTLDPRLAGTWKSGLEMSQLGPAGMRFRIDCDCRYRVKARVFLFMTIRERGPVWSEPSSDASTGEADGTLVFGRASGDETQWPYRIEGEQLFLEEAPGEWTPMKRTRVHRCSRHP